MKWYVYMLMCGDSSIYTGYTNDVFKRTIAHQNGKGAKYTKSRLPVTLVYAKQLPTKSAALKREYQIKQLSRKEKLKLIYEKSSISTKNP